MTCDALYIHIPFCLRKCPYCAFYSVPAEEGLIAAYTAAIVRAIETAPYALAPLDTIYFGGGTPSLVGDRAIAAMLDAAAKRYGIASGAEITVECNPHSSLPATLAGLHAAGVNRLSFGLQSANDDQLRLLGRPHNRTQAEQAVKLAQQAGFAHLSLDLMLATPGQSFADLDEAAALCDALGAEHLSAYLLGIEEGTPFAVQDIAARCPDSDGQAALYQYAVEAFASHGYRQYEISNFARDGRVARHNLKYWLCAEYLGLGPSAHSFVEGRRRYFENDLAAFLAPGDLFARMREDGPGGDAEERIMLGLRLAQGVDLGLLQADFPSYDFARLLRAAKQVPAHLLVREGERLRLTTEGFLLSNTVIGALLA